MSINFQFSKLELMQGRVKFIPTDWDFLHLKKAFNIHNNLRLPINETERLKIPGLYPYYGPTKIQGYIETYQQDGDYVLIGEDGDHFLKYRTLSMTNMITGKCTVNNHAHIIEGTKKAINKWFYYYFMHRDIFSFLTRQGAGRYKLNKAALEKLPILVPPVPEQQKITQILSTWDKAIEKLEALIAAKKKRKKALMQQLLTGKKRFSGFEEEWNELMVNEIGGIITGNTPLKLESDNYGGSTSWATAEDFNGKFVKNTVIKLSKKGVSKARLVPKGAVLVTCIASIGKNGIANEIMATNQQINAVVVNEQNNNEFFYYLIEYFENKLLSFAGITAIPILNKTSFGKIKFLIPKLKEQQKIASVLSSADNEIETHQKQLDAFKQQKKGLMQQLLTGKKRVKPDNGKPHV